MKIAPAMWTALLALSFCAHAALEITEFSTNSDNRALDEDGESVDWIELRNVGNSPISTLGYTLTDDRNEPAKWPLPDVRLSPGGFLLVFASGKDRSNPGAELHAGFSLTSSPGHLALFKPDGITRASAFDYPRQFYGVSFGAGGYFGTPTPGTPNGPVDFTDFVRDTSFSADRGFYEDPIRVEITTRTEGASIYYTTDATVPSPANGTLYTGPVLIETTTVLRAVATRPGLVSSNVDTQTYIFLADVIRQPAAPPGAPATWGVDNSVAQGATNLPRPADYEMDPGIIGQFGEEAVLAALRNHPTISVVLEPEDLWNESRDPAIGGIYPNPYGGTGNQFLPGQGEPRDWERPASAEFIGFPKVPGRQVNCGIRIGGNYARHPNRYKHHLRLTFRREYGPGRLRAPLFSRTSVDTFDNLILRGGNSESWTFPASAGNGTTTRANVQYIRDQFYKDAQVAMGHLSANQEYFHLYLNGLYWGFYTLIERIDGHFLSQHLGGEPEDYDAFKQSDTLIDGDRRAWDGMFRVSRGNMASARSYEVIQGLLDIDNFIDYVLFNFWAGTADWRNNWRAGRRREEGAGFMFFMWDGERGLGDRWPRNFDFNSSSTNREWPVHATELHHNLKANEEYLIRFADRLNRHFFNDGVLSPENAAALYNARAEEIRPSLVAESARWGDRSRPNAPYTTRNEWQDMLDFMNEEFFPGRLAVFLNQLRVGGVYPISRAPVFSQHGGQVPGGYNLELSSTAGQVYLTTDGSDPRLVGGAISPSARPAGNLVIDSPTMVRARVLRNGEWSAITEATFLTGVPASSGNLVISEILYNPEGPSEDGEFIELLNISDEEINLAGVRFEDGIQYAFAAGDRLAPGQRLVLTPNEYTGLLANGGEPLSLLAYDGTVIRSFRFDDGAPWAESADGDGFSLVLADPASNPDPGLPQNWLPSSAPGGTPAGSDAVAYQPGMNLLGHALGPQPLAVGVEDEQVVLEVRRSLTGGGVSLEIETSRDLKNWTGGEAVFAGFESHSGGYVTMRWHLPPGEGSAYARVRLSSGQP